MKSIFCVDKNWLPKDSAIQKKIPLDDLVNSHCKYFNSEEEALKDNYVPLNFAVSVRSCYTNLVLQKETENGFRYYLNLVSTPFVHHKSYDLIMYLSSLALMTTVDYNIGFDEIMMSSQYQPIGVYNSLLELHNPIIYSHIILKDDVVEDFKKYLKPEYKLVPISEMQKQGNIYPLVDTIINIKEEVK